jgi:hypothetical protein
MRPRLPVVALTLVVLLSVVGASVALGLPLGAGKPAPAPTRSSNPNDDKDSCRDGNAGKGNSKKPCPTPTPSSTPTPSESPTPDPTETTPPPTTAAKVGFGTRAITPVGEPPAAWAQFFTPHPETKVWGEPYTDTNGNDCYDAPHFTDIPAPDNPHLAGQPEPHVDQPWNSAGDAHENGAFSVDGVTIYGDPQSSGKWDGVWANAGFGSKCTLGMHDDTWARAVVVEVGDKTVALVSLDVVGLFNIEVQRARRELALRYPDMEIDELVVSSTHTHEGVDTMGYWGQALGIDGKFPAYNAFIRSQLIDAVHEAYSEREPALAKFAQTELTMGIRDSRPPHRIDPYLLAAQFVRPSDGSTIGTIVNWSNHPEAQGSNNQLVSSDFPHGTREVLERDLGGTSVYFSGSVGGLMTPLGVNILGYGSNVSWERTYEIGRLVAEAAKESLAAAPLEGLNDLVHERREFYMQADNTALNGLNAAGVFDIPTYIGANSWGLDGHTEGAYAGRSGPQFKTEMVAVEFGPALFLTVPGELFPEIELGGYGRPDCEAADTGRPYEPVISEQFDSEYQFILGLGQDELGYIVPGYDFWLKHVDDLPNDNGHHEGPIALGALEEKDPCGEGHYEETVSGSSAMAPWVACVAAELSGKDPWAMSATGETYAACTHENTHMNPYGANPDGVHPPGGARSGGFEHPDGYYEHLHEHELEAAHSHS